MNTTISDPTPAPEMPVMWAVAWQSRTGEWKLTGGLNEEGHRYIAAASPGSRLIKIDPNAPSFEPGPTEWDGKTVESGEYTVWINKNGKYVPLENSSRLGLTVDFQQLQ